ncbi:hypothetical protein Ahy_B05g074007 [Arachis hypogaea]|uniref:PB1-like domain-containing protein n=1 Tax=Arachis hypogaea TaxID=3818 RepID=A0A444YXN1_ARAHY|nr:hypothetical protein Ahy_B05g074007 [Arachis hypogaea]
MGDPWITIMFHHGGLFVTERDGTVNYSGGQIFQLPRVDVDTVDVFFIRDYYKTLGYDNVTHCWWLVPNRPLQRGLRALTHDKELMEMCYAAQTNKGVVHVYYEHGVSEPVFDEKTGLASSKGKELIVLPDPIPHTYSSINVTANRISTTSPPIPTSEPMNTTIHTPTTIPPTMPTGISQPKHKSYHTATSVSYSKSPPKEMAAPTAAAPSVKLTPPPKTMAKPTVATTSKPNPRPKRMGQSTAAPTTKPNPPPKSMAQPTSKPVTRSTSQKSRRSDIPKRGPQKVKNAALHARKPLTRSAATGTFGRASVKGKDPETVFVSLSSEEESSDSHDSYDSVEDEPYKPAADDVSSEEEEVVGKRSTGKKSDAKKRTDNREVNEKSSVMLEDDGIVCAESGSEDDEFFFGPIPKRNCHKRAVDEESAAVAAAAAAANSEANGGEVNNSAPTAAVNGGDAPAVSQDQVEIQLDLSQPILSETDDSQQVQQPPVRPPKLPPKRKLSTPSATTQPSSTPSASTASTPSASTPSATTPSASTLPTSSQPASTETATNLPAMRFVPNPGFKPPRTKN